MFTHMRPIRSAEHQTRNATFTLHVYQVDETNEYRIYVSKAGLGVGDIFTASQEIVDDAKNTVGLDMVESLINTAKNDIDQNEYNQY